MLNKEDLEELIEEILGYLWILGFESSGVTEYNNDYFYVKLNPIADKDNVQDVKVDISDYNWNNDDCIYFESYTAQKAKDIVTKYF